MNGRFQKGESGNPGGRPRAAHSIQELARKHTMEALDVLVQIMLPVTYCAKTCLGQGSFAQGNRADPHPQVQSTS